MSLTLGDNFSYGGSKPLDARLIYSTLADMKAVADSTMYNGCLAYCVATDKTYQWKSSNTVDADTGKWREFSSGGAEITVDNALSSTSENPVQNKVIYDALEDKADLVDGKIPSSQLPSYVDDVLEYASMSAFPATGETGKIYIALDTNKTYRWSGSAYVEISESLALGETSSTAYRGDRGAEAYTKANKAYLSDDTAFTDLADGDYIPVYDTSATTKKKTLWSNIKSLLKTYFDGFYYSRTDSAITSLDDADAVPVYDDSDTAKRKITWSNLKDEIVGLGIGGGYAPVGTIISFMGNTAPQDYLACNGATYNIADYPQLANFFQAQFGSKNYFGGNGTTTFKVPDLRGEFLRGTGTNGHTNQGNGANVGSHQDATSDVYHEFNSAGVMTINGKSLDRSIGNADSTYNGTATNSGRDIYNLTKTTDTYTGKNIFYTSRPTNTSIMWCIKAVAAGEVYSTEERVVATWIDGKPVYQKTIDLGGLTDTGNTQTSKYVDLGASVNEYIGYQILCNVKSGANIVWQGGVSYIADAGDSAITPSLNTNHQSDSSLRNKVGVTYLGSLSWVTNVRMTLQYTKTTD